MPDKQFNKIAKDFSVDISFGKQYGVIPTILSMVPNVKGSILDAGCGRGEITREIAKNSSESIIGVDISKEMIKIAKEAEKTDPLGISYYCKDILKFKPTTKVDYIISVFLLNYAENERDLRKMFTVFSESLTNDGKCFIITINPNLKPSKTLLGNRRHINVLGKKVFENGDKIKTEIKKDKKAISFIHYYYSKDVYEDAAEKAGFKKIKWVQPIVSSEAIKKFGKKFCEEYLETTSTIGFVCSK
ncbi:MAG: class I SAM-dependent methyltransferase [Candidatus Diapherotrites archaeon]|jgi:toxoflavin synthase|nr:class I SAM-dependent methyltransferase [Candidatus Diapherotrites archaeon]MBT4596619.1 class I SAM-dependent methyltransferase [Candidatus Diapherotrites archaeon]